MKKRCTKCKRRKDKEKFYKNRGNKDGLSFQCKKCHKKGMKKYRKSEKGKETQRKYLKSKEYKKAQKKWKKSEKGKEAARKHIREYDRKHPEEYACHLAYNNALNRGELVRPRECSVCGDNENIPHGHHEDYSKPLEVIWLCRKCHLKTKKRAYMSDKDKKLWPEPIYLTGNDNRPLMRMNWFGVVVCDEEWKAVKRVLDAAAKIQIPDGDVYDAILGLEEYRNACDVLDEGRKGRT